MSDLWYRKKPYVEFLAVIAVTSALLLLYVRENTNYNFALLADSFLHGHAWVDWPGSNIDAVPFNGKRYIIEGPAPAILSMPLVAILGPGGWTGEISSLLTGVICVGLFWWLFKRLGLDRTKRLWLTAFVFAGTDLWWCASAAGVWYVSVVFSNALAAATFLELAGKRRGWLIGLLTVLTIETRMTMLSIVLLYPLLLIARTFGETTNLPGTLKRYGLVLVAGAAASIGYNEVRWGCINDIGYQVWCAQDFVCRFGLFGFKYFGYELYSFFFRPPDIKVTDEMVYYPYFGVSVEGMALTFTSPALIFAFWARRNFSVVCLWLATILTAIPSLFYYVNGYLQVGMRHAMDFEPFLFVLMALAMRDNMRHWVYYLMSVSIFVSTWQVWYWWNFMDK